MQDCGQSRLTAWPLCIHPNLPLRELRSCRSEAVRFKGSASRMGRDRRTRMKEGGPLQNSSETTHTRHPRPAQNLRARPFATGTTKKSQPGSCLAKTTVHKAGLNSLNHAKPAPRVLHSPLHPGHTPAELPSQDASSKCHSMPAPPASPPHHKKKRTWLERCGCTAPWLRQA